MKWEMEIMSPDSSYVSNSSWLFEEKTNWTPAENKAFENALAVFDKDTPDRWHRVAEMVPTKSVVDVIRQYKELEDDVSSIEAGLFPILGHGNGNGTSGFTLEWGSGGQDFDGFKQFSHGLTGKRSSSTRTSDHERKKGVPWTEEEHKLFLMGLKKYGKGDWRNISRNYVITRTPTQVASHAQKYFARQISGGKDKRRASIHDITTVSLHDSQMSSPENNKKTPSPEHGGTTTTTSAVLSQSSATNKNPFQWGHGNNGTLMNFNTGGLGNNVSFYDVNNKSQNMQKGAIFDAYLGCQNMMFQMQSTHQYHHA